MADRRDATDMAKKGRRVARPASANKDGRWTVRGVPVELQKAAGDAARARGLTLGRWLTEALAACVARDAPPATAAMGWTEAIEQRLLRLEQAVLAGRPAETTAAGSAAH